MVEILMMAMHTGIGVGRQPDLCRAGLFKHSDRLRHNDILWKNI
jgi:hypothetical protein